MIFRAIRLMTGGLVTVVLAAALANPADARRGITPHKVRADARGYFFYPANYTDDAYVYDPPATRRHAKAHRTSLRHHPRASSHRQHTTLR